MKSNTYNSIKSYMIDEIFDIVSKYINGDTK